MDDVQVEEFAPRRRIASKGTSDNDSLRSSPTVSDVASYIFDSNDAGLIDNPLLHWPPAQVERKARQFARDYGLGNHEAVLIKAAKILRDPEAWQSVPHLTAEETQALGHERSEGFWKQPKELKVTIMTLCVAAVVQGWNQTASNGANLNWPRQLGLKNLDGCQPQGREAWIFASVNAASYLSASLIGCWLSDPASEYLLGRRGPVFMSALVVISSMIGSALTQTWQQLLGCRVVLGVGMGLKAAIVPVFAAEVAPAHIRGSLVMNWQLFDALGIFLGFTANLVVSQTGRHAWRWQTASSVLPTIVLLTLIFVCPESPRFLMKHQRYLAAYKTLVLLRGEPVIAAKELLYVHYQMEVEMRHLRHKRPDPEEDETVRHHETIDGEKEAVGVRSNRDKFLPQSGRGINYWQKLGQLFTQKRIRRAMVAAVVCMVGQQICGVNVLSFYSSTFFCDTGKTNATHPGYLKPLFLSWGIGFMNFLFAFPAYYLIDKKGRRWLLLVALPFMSLCMLAAAFSFLIPMESSAHAPVIVFWTYVFMFFYSWSMGPVPFTMSAEVFPLENRVVGMSFAVFVNLFGAGLLTLFVPWLTLKLTHVGLLGLFAALNLVALVLVFFFVRETAGAALGGTQGSMTFMSLEELNYIFGVSTKKHIQHQLTVVVPWAWRYYVKRDKTCPDQPQKLYTWALASTHGRADDPEVEEAMAHASES